MTGADFIIAINLLAAGLLASAFLALGLFAERRAAAWWFAACYAVGAANFLFELLLPRTGGDWAVGFGAFAAFLVALAFLNVGIARLYGLGVPWRTLAVLFVAGCVLRLAIDGMGRELMSRQLLYQAPYAAMQAAGVWLLWRARRRVLDTALLGVLCLASIHYLLKPLISAAAGGVGASAEGYSATLYAMISQSSGTVLGLGTALLLGAIVVRDVLEGMAARADTDSLSGLFNRQAFERQRDAMLLQREGGPPLSLVLCDLDDFKLVNDTYGHAAGDRVISEFGRLLTQSTRDGQPASRIGGEEFAVLLPGANLAAARLFAEHLRTAFAVMPIEGLASGHHCTASFGVAEATAGETGEELQARADAALYAAKRGGRDCVRVATPSEVNGEPSRAGGSAWRSGRERRG
jgi:diguanylate cyclase (GGDEF)-like protein